MHSHMQTIHEAVTKKKIKTAEGVWKVLCKKYSSVSNTQYFLYGRRRDYLYFTRTFETRHTRKSFIRSFNSYFNKKELNANGPLAEMLRTFLTCYPEFLPDLNKNIIAVLNIQPYLLPLDIETADIKDNFLKQKLASAHLTALHANKFSEEELIRVIVMMCADLGYETVYQIIIDAEKINEINTLNEALDLVFETRPEIVAKLESRCLELLQETAEVEITMRILGKICERPESNPDIIASALLAHSSSDDKLKVLKYYVLGKLSQSRRVNLDFLVADLIKKLKNSHWDSETVGNAAFYACGRLALKSNVTSVCPGDDLTQLFFALEEKIIHLNIDAQSELQLKEEEDRIYSRETLLKLLFIHFVAQPQLGFTPYLLEASTKLSNNCLQAANKALEALINIFFINNESVSIPDALAKKLVEIRYTSVFVIYALASIGEYSQEELKTILPIFLQKLTDPKIFFNDDEINIHLQNLRTRIFEQLDKQIQQTPDDQAIQDRRNNLLEDPKYIKQMLDGLIEILPNISVQILETLDILISKKPNTNLTQFVPYLVEKLKGEKQAELEKELLKKISKRVEIKIQANQLPDLVLMLKDNKRHVDRSNTNAEFIIASIAHIKDVEQPWVCIAETLLENFQKDKYYSYDFPMVCEALGEICKREEVDFKPILLALLERMIINGCVYKENIFSALASISEREDMDSSLILPVLSNILQLEKISDDEKKAAIIASGKIAKNKKSVYEPIVKILVKIIHEDNDRSENSEAAAESLLLISEREEVNFLVIIPALFTILDKKLYSLADKTADRIVFLVSNLQNQAHKQYFINVLLPSEISKNSKGENPILLISILERVRHESALRFYLKYGEPKLPDDVVRLVRSY